MKLSATQENLAKALSVVSRVLTNRPSLPVLSNVLLKTEASRLMLVATNLEMALSYTIGAKIEAEGAVTVPGRLLNELINSLSRDTIALIAAEHNLQIKSQNLESLLNGINPDDFPLIPKIKPKSTVTIPGAILQDCLSEVIIAAAVDEARPVLNGVLFSFSKGKLTLAATDSYRLAESSITITNTKEFSAIVPARTATELIRLLSSEDKSVKIEATESEIVFSVGAATLISRLIEGNYPDYRQIFPENHTTSATVEREALLQAVRISSLFARESANTLKLKVEKNKINIITSTSEIGQNNSTIDAKTTGDSLSIQLNSKYILNALTTISTPTINLELTGELSPAILRPKVAPKNTNSSVHIIMPLRS